MINNTSARRDLVVSSIQLTGEFSTPDLALPLVIRPGQSAAVTVRFAPTLPRDAVGVATIFSNDPDAGPVSVNLLGRGLWPILRIEPTAIDFGTTIVSTTTFRDVWISNVRPGNWQLVVPTFGLVGQIGGPFEVFGSTLPVVLSPGQRKLFRVRFIPSGAQSLAGSITVKSNDPVTPTASVSLTGIALHARRPGSAPPLHVPWHGGLELSAPPHDHRPPEE